MSALGVEVAFAVLAAVGWTAWRFWLQVLRVQAQRADKLIVETWQEYLNGRVALESSAQELARLWRRKTSISVRLSIAGARRPDSRGQIPFPLPPGIDANDPRLDPLGERASAIFVERTGKYLDDLKRRRAKIR